MENKFTWSTSTATAILLHDFAGNLRKPRAGKKQNRQKRISRQTPNHRRLVDKIPEQVGTSSDYFRKMSTKRGHQAIPVDTTDIESEREVF